MSEWSTEVTVCVESVRKVYGVSGESLDRLDVWRIGSTGFPVFIGALLHAADAETARWEVRDGWPIGPGEREAVRFEAAHAWETHLEMAAPEQSPSDQGSERERNRS